MQWIDGAGGVGGTKSSVTQLSDATQRNVVNGPATVLSCCATGYDPKVGFLGRFCVGLHGQS